jgi:hypothetical protein
MADRLLDRQAKLLDYLTSGGAIFGDDAAAPLDPALHGIDRGLLRLEAQFSRDKRLEKVAAAFPRTFALLGDDRPSIVRAFVEACPPVDISRLENARQFFGFLSASLAKAPIGPPYLRDVAMCEYACARLRAGGAASPPEPADGPRHAIRRSTGVILLRCDHDVRAIFEDGAPKRAPGRRDTLLAVALPAGVVDPRFFEIAPVVFDLLAGLDQWTDPAQFGSARDLQALIRELADHGLVDVRAVDTQEPGARKIEAQQ